MPDRIAPPQRLPSQLVALRGHEQAHWLCQSLGDDAPAVLVTGWTGLVRRLAIDCIDIVAAPAALAQAEVWLLNAGTWHFDVQGSGSALWRIVRPDGAWAATLMIENRTLDEAWRTLSQ